MTEAAESERSKRISVSRCTLALSSTGMVRSLSGSCKYIKEISDIQKALTLISTLHCSLQLVIRLGVLNRIAMRFSDVVGIHIETYHVFSGKKYF